MSAPLIRVEGLSKHYGNRAVMKALDLEFPAGEFSVVLGPSGCGKSTLLRTIAGLEPSDEGVVRIGDRDVTRMPPQHRGCAMVFQNYALYPHMSVGDNIGYALKLAGVERQEREQRVREAAVLLGLHELLGRRPAQLSGGQRQRVAIGRAIARRQKVLLFDEPLSNLDAKLRHEMRLELRRLHDEIGATTVFVTHDQTEAMTLGDRVVLLNQGRVEQMGTPMELYQRPCSTFVAGFIGTPPMNLLTAQRENGTAVIEGGGELPLGLDLHRPLVLTLGIRPEAIVLDDPTGIVSVVEAVEDLGSHRVVYGRIGPQRITLTHAGPRRFVRGETLRLGFPLEAVSCFDAVSGERIDTRGIRFHQAS